MALERVRDYLLIETEFYLDWEAIEKPWEDHPYSHDTVVMPRDPVHRQLRKGSWLYLFDRRCCTNIPPRVTDQPNSHGVQLQNSANTFLGICLKFPFVYPIKVVSGGHLNRSAHFGKEMLPKSTCEHFVSITDDWARNAMKFEHRLDEHICNCYTREVTF